MVAPLSSLKIIPHEQYMSQDFLEDSKGCMLFRLKVSDFLRNKLRKQNLQILTPKDILLSALYLSLALLLQTSDKKQHVFKG